MREASKDEKTVAIEAKENFIAQLRESIGEFVPENQVQKIMSAVADVLAHFDMNEIQENLAESEDYLAGYLQATKVQGRSGQTVKRYRYIITRMMNAVKVPCRQITVNHLRSYFTAERNRGVADSTLEGVRQVLSAYFGWLKNEGLIDKNPTINLRKIKHPKKKKEILTDAEIAKLYRACTNARDLAIISFLRETGCRVSEMTGLDRRDINISNKRCWVYGKGDKERVVYFKDITAAYLKEYLDSRTDDCEALFTNRFGERLQNDGVRIILNKIASAAGIKKHIHPHMFRRTLASNLSKHGMPVQEIAVILGHDKIDTTMQYVVLDIDDTQNSYKKYA